MLGFEPEETIEKNVFGLVHPDDINTLKDYLSQMKPFSHNDMPLLRFKNTLGEWRWIESKVTDMSDNPEVAGYVFNCRDVTERKIVEENLANISAELQHALTEQVLLRKKTEGSETRLKEAQAIAHVGHWNLNFATQTALWSDEACRIYGLSPEENKQSYASWVSFIHPEDLDYVMKVTTESQKTLSDTTLSHRIVLKDGTVKYIIAKSKFEFDENGKPAGLYGISHDVTESKIAEDEIKKLSFIAQETNNVVIITDPLGEIVWVNEAFTRTTEFEFEEAVGKKPGDFLQGEETNLAVVRYMHGKLKNTEPFECDILNYSKSGKKYWLRIQSQPQFDEAGKLKYFFAVETDITKEKEAEQVLKTSEERYRYLFNNNPASILIWDLETLEVMEINETAIALYGYSREEFLTKTVMDLRLPVQHDKIKDFAADMLQETDLIAVKNWIHIKKSGEEMCLNISSHHIQFKGRPVILSLATDITEKIKLEKELENEKLLKHQEITKAVISAQEQERQELGGELHDNVNQILAGSLLYLGLAKKELNIDHPYLKETDTLINTAIQEIRNLSHSLIPPSLHESEFLDALKNIIESTQKTSGITISLQACGFDESSIPDKLKLTIYRIVQEQLNNILKHAAAQKVIIHLVKDNEKNLLSIKDDGAGFDTAKKSNGVGLMNIKTRASLFSGDVSIISSPGKGCELRVLFN
jgi:PAS domain S-box-containing protein